MMPIIILTMKVGTDPGFQVRGVEDKHKKEKKNSNALLYIINKLSTNTNTQNHYFLIY